MKINIEDLKKLYREYLIENTPPSREKCLSPEAIISAVRGRDSVEQRVDFLKHTTHCDFCLKEFGFVFQIIKQEKKTTRKLKKIFRSKNSSPKKNDERGSHSSTVQNIVSFLKYKRFATVMFLTVFVIASVSIYLVNRLGDQKIRGTTQDHIQLLHPVNKKLEKSDLIFTWKSLERALYFRIEIFDETLYPFWSSDKIIKKNLILPNHVLNSMSSGSAYFWQVTAVLPDGEKIESKLGRFIINIQK